MKIKGYTRKGHVVMSKEDIINELYIKYDVWECGYTVSQLRSLTKKKLLSWLKELR